jgi:hypothetical protein
MFSAFNIEGIPREILINSLQRGVPKIKPNWVKCGE